MNEIRRALFAVLDGDNTLAGLLSAPHAIYHERAPQSAEPPFIIFHKQSGTPDWTFRDHTQWDLWTIKGVDRSESASAAEAIATRVDVLLNDVSLTITGQRHLYTRRSSDVDYSEDDNAETYRHVGAIYRVITQPS